ncbi:hypothetical protein NC653_010862 [Populus alba x Populus x berolinensis]|uniref:Uncharacterized protein n=1 Tax=Populus alba x Populus x berolinensis TaxID=444605 RepID=A0AAD6W5P1_9ROSI|nr:hypothetical protein NC653_010862 [Populus alba x Populus x berolinensis]
MSLHTPSMISLLPSRPALSSLRSISKGLMNQADEARALLVKRLNADGNVETKKGRLGIN